MKGNDVKGVVASMYGFEEAPVSVVSGHEELQLVLMSVANSGICCIMRDGATLVSVMYCFTTGLSTAACPSSLSLATAASRLRLLHLPHSVSLPIWLRYLPLPLFLVAQHPVAKLIHQPAHSTVMLRTLFFTDSKCK
jgi:hypothetical protein